MSFKVTTTDEEVLGWVRKITIKDEDGTSLDAVYHGKKVMATNQTGITENQIGHPNGMKMTMMVYSQSGGQMKRVANE